MVRVSAVITIIAFAVSKEGKSRIVENRRFLKCRLFVWACLKWLRVNRSSEKKETFEAVNNGEFPALKGQTFCSSEKNHLDCLTAQRSEIGPQSFFSLSAVWARNAKRWHHRKRVLLIRSRLYDWPRYRERVISP